MIAGAGLDVYTDEPNVPERLLRLANPTHETRQAMSNLVLENLTTYVKTGPVKVAVP